ncbi:unnamed protein product [Phytophthora lilii]|uniref:Unnamed protein product n=1 Tax=Phytophthora lilii TaxID=2077276 RepID=A0A9W6TY05_9STRA|nr:unnamed protein product [Phytophthora lilii]
MESSTLHSLLRINLLSTLTSNEVARKSHGHGLNQKPVPAAGKRRDALPPPAPAAGGPVVTRLVLWYDCRRQLAAMLASGMDEAVDSQEPADWGQLTLCCGPSRSRKLCFWPY